MDTIVNLNDTNNMDYEFYQLIVDKKLLSLSLCEFFTATEFDPNMYFSSTFWFALNQLNDNDWFEVTDDVIEKVGFKGDNKKSNQRTHLFDCLKHNFTEYIHYTFTLGKTRPITGRGGHNKKTLHMKRDSFKKLLMKVNTKNSDQMRKEDLIPFIPPRQNMSKRKLLLLPTNETKRSINDITRYFETK